MDLRNRKLTEHDNHNADESLEKVETQHERSLDVYTSNTNEEEQIDSDRGDGNQEELHERPVDWTVILRHMQNMGQDINKMGQRMEEMKQDLKQDNQARLEDMKQDLKRDNQNMKEEMTKKLEEQGKEIRKIRNDTIQIRKDITEQENKLREEIVENGLKIRNELEKITMEIRQDLEGQINHTQDKIGDIHKEVETIVLRVNIESQETNDKIQEIKNGIEMVELTLMNGMKENKQELENKVEQVVRENKDTMERLRKNIDDNGKKTNVLEREYIGEQLREEMLARTEDRIKQIEEKLRREIGNRQVERIFMSGCGSQNFMKFDGEIKRIHPKIFIRSLRNKVNINDPIDNLREVIRDCLGGNALLWFNSREFGINNFEEFESQFINYYWGEHAQTLARERLYFGKFDHNRGTSMNNYALAMFNAAQHLEPPMREEDLVLYISRHFRNGMAETIAIQGINTMDQFSKYLQRIDRNVTGPYDNSYRSGGYNNNYNGRTQFQNRNHTNNSQRNIDNNQRNNEAYRNNNDYNRNGYNNNNRNRSYNNDYRYNGDYNQGNQQRERYPRQEKRNSEQDGQRNNRHINCSRTERSEETHAQRRENIQEDTAVMGHREDTSEQNF